MITKLRKELQSVEDYFKDVFGKSPYFHVSDRIHNKEEHEAIFQGKFHGYSRLGGQLDHVSLEGKIKKMEGAQTVRVRSDGMGAVAMALIGLAIYMLSVKKLERAKIIVILPVYGGTYDLAKFYTESALFNIEFVFLFANNPHLYEKLHRVIDADTIAIYFEITANPTLAFVNARKIIEIAKNHPANPAVIVDNTFLSFIAKPCEWGADLIVHSGTKYTVGVSAWPLGYIGISPDFAKREPGCWHALLRWSYGHGGTLGPFEAFMTGEFAFEDGEERVVQHSRNALSLAYLLKHNKYIEKVVYPGLEEYGYRENFDSHIQPLRGEMAYGGMIFFYIRGAALEKTNEFLFHLTNNSHVKNAASLGSDQDMVENAWDLSHRGMLEHDKITANILPNSVRFSVGVCNSSGETYESVDKSLYATFG